MSKFNESPPVMDGPSDPDALTEAAMRSAVENLREGGIVRLVAEKMICRGCGDAYQPHKNSTGFCASCMQPVFLVACYVGRLNKEMPDAIRPMRNFSQDLWHILEDAVAELDEAEKKTKKEAA